MNADSLCISKVGLVTAVGLDAVSSCAALRAKLSNPSESHFVDREGRYITAQQVDLGVPWTGITRLAKMACMAIAEALQGVAVTRWNEIPLLLCVAEPTRPGRREDLDNELLTMIRGELEVQFSESSAVVAHGRVGVAVALSYARKLLSDSGVEQVVVVGADSLLSVATLHHLSQQDRLLTDDNSNGFIPGEGAGALLLARDDGPGALVCTGIGFGREESTVQSDQPLRAEGLSQAITAALADARCNLSDIDFRIADIAGEHYYFKETSLALSRSLRHRKESFDLWHPAECTGEVGAVAGIVALAAALAACQKGYAIGPGVLIHLANDDGARAALTLRYLELR